MRWIRIGVLQAERTPGSLETAGRTKDQNFSNQDRKMGSVIPTEAGGAGIHL